MSEPDYEAIMEDREERRAEAWTDRMDGRYGRIEDWRRREPAACSFCGHPASGHAGNGEGLCVYCPCIGWRP